MWDQVTMADFYVTRHMFLAALAPAPTNEEIDAEATKDHTTLRWRSRLKIEFDLRLRWANGLAKTAEAWQG